MSLIKCSECGKDISDKAAACPNCGNPITTNKSILKESPVVTVQKTYKSWKLTKIICWLMLLFGLLSLQNGESGMALGGLLITFGIIGLIIAKFGSWWSTG